MHYREFVIYLRIRRGMALVWDQTDLLRHGLAGEGEDKDKAVVGQTHA